MPAGPAQGNMAHRDPAFPSQAPYCREHANFLSGLAGVGGVVAPDRGTIQSQLLTNREETGDPPVRLCVVQMKLSFV